MENLLHGHGWVGPGAQRGLGVDEFALSVVNSLAISASPSSPFALSTGGRGIEGGGVSQLCYNAACCSRDKVSRLVIE